MPRRPRWLPRGWVMTVSTASQQRRDHDSVSARGDALRRFQRLVAVNLTGQFATTQALIPQLRAAAGQIVFVSSISGRKAMPMLAAYSASVAGLNTPRRVGFRRAQSASTGRAALRPSVDASVPQWTKRPIAGLFAGARRFECRRLAALEVLRRARPPSGRRAEDALPGRQRSRSRRAVRLSMSSRRSARRPARRPPAPAFIGSGSMPADKRLRCAWCPIAVIACRR